MVTEYIPFHRVIITYILLIIFDDLIFYFMAVSLLVTTKLLLPQEIFISPYFFKGLGFYTLVKLKNITGNLIDIASRYAY